MNVPRHDAKNNFKKFIRVNYVDKSTIFAIQIIKSERMIRAIIQLGSNMGERSVYLDNAKLRVHLLAGNVIKSSSVYETAPWGNKDQPPFLNQVLVVETNLEPALFLSTMLAIEASLGRTRNEKWAPRTLDIDVLFFGDQVIQNEKLVVPHPAIADRRFVLIPLYEILPDFMHPVLQKSIATLLADCADPLEVKLISAS